MSGFSGIFYLNFYDLPLYFLSEVKNTQGWLMNERTRRRAGIKEINIFDLMIGWGMGVPIDDRIDLIKFPPNS
jgi:hypothetical protein